MSIISLAAHLSQPFSDYTIYEVIVMKWWSYNCEDTLTSSVITGTIFPFSSFQPQSSGSIRVAIIVFHCITCRYTRRLWNQADLVVGGSFAGISFLEPAAIFIYWLYRNVERSSFSLAPYIIKNSATPSSPISSWLMPGVIKDWHSAFFDLSTIRNTADFPFSKIAEVVSQPVNACITNRFERTHLESTLTEELMDICFSCLILFFL